MAKANGMNRWLPGVGVLRTYKRSWLWPDVRAGLVVTALLIPAGMGYAEVAGLPPEAGLYATIVPLIAYAVFGTSKQLVTGPSATVAAVSAAAIGPLVGASRSGLTRQPPMPPASRSRPPPSISCSACPAFRAPTCSSSGEPCRRSPTRAP